MIKRDFKLFSTLFMDEDEEQYYIEHEKRVTEEINEFIENYDF